MLNRGPKIFFIFMSLVFFLAACAGEQSTPVIVEVTQPVLQTVIVTQLVEVIITATPQPATATPFPSPTLPIIPTPPSGAMEASASQMAVGNMGDVTFWCLPAGDFIDPAGYLSAPPLNAVVGQIIKGQLEYAGEFSQCTFVYDFKSPVPQGAQFEAKDNSSSIPFLAVKLSPDPANPNKGYAVLMHGMITAPPAWEILFQFSVTSPSSSAVWTSPAHYDRGWRAPVCWTGLKPNPVTLACPAWQDTHPSDPGYTPPAPETNTE